MENNYVALELRRTAQSHDLGYVIGLMHRANVTPTPRAFDENGKKLRRDKAKDVSDILQILLEYGTPYQRNFSGKFIHQIELAKALLMFQDDAKNPHFDTGVRRIVRLMPEVNKKLMLQGKSLANLPGAGYRIASPSEAVFEVKKSILRSFGSIKAALEKSTMGVYLPALSPMERKELSDIAQFIKTTARRFEEEISADELDITEPAEEYSIAKNQINDVEPLPLS